MSFLDKLVPYRKSRVAREILALYGVEIPAAVVIGKQFSLVHRGLGTVPHLDCLIGDDVVLCPGAKVLGKAGVTTIGRGKLVGANAVLMQPTGENEIWAGIPARKVGMRTDLPAD